MKDLLAGFPVVVEQPVVWGDMDAYGHVNNVVYFRYFENARLEYFRQMGWLEVEEATGIGPILAATTARFRKALRYPDQISIAARAIHLRADRFTLEHRIVSRRLEAITTVGEGVVVSFHHGQGQKAPLPESLRQRIEEMEASVGHSLASEEEKSSPTSDPAPPEGGAGKV